jgi:hypothetical protein
MKAKHIILSSVGAVALLTLFTGCGDDEVTYVPTTSRTVRETHTYSSPTATYGEPYGATTTTRRTVTADPYGDPYTTTTRRTTTYGNGLVQPVDYTTTVQRKTTTVY